MIRMRFPGSQPKLSLGYPASIAGGSDEPLPLEISLEHLAEAINYRQHDRGTALLLHKLPGLNFLFS